MHKLIIFAISLIVGFLVGLSLTYLFNILPESWLQDYGYNPQAPDYRPSKRMKIVPHGILSGVFCASFYVVFSYFCSTIIYSGNILHITAYIIVVPVLFLILISDKLNRIIPDQFWIVILACGILLLISDYVEGTIWFSEQSAWYFPIVNRVGGAIVGGGSLLLISFLASFLTSREAMGHGDMKLLIACGMATGLYGLIVLIYVSVFSALIFAIPLFVKKQKRIREEEDYINNSENPRLARHELEIEKAKIHFADDPDYLAFGPFLALGAGVFLALEPVFFSFMRDTLFSLGLLF